MDLSRFGLGLAFFFGLAFAAGPSAAAPEPNTCASGKLACSSKKAAAVLKCYSKAQKAGALVSSECLSKAQTSFDECFAKVESKQVPGKPATVCRTTGDDDVLTAAIDELTRDTACAADPASCPRQACAHSPCLAGAALSECNDCVARVCQTDELDSCCTTMWDARCVAAVEPLCGIDCSSYTEPPSTCTAAKTNCAAKRLRGLLTCFSKAQKKGVALDPTCIDKVETKFDGGADPAAGCFAKAEAKQNSAKPPTYCPVTGDSHDAANFSDYATERLACTLEDDNCSCCGGQCNEIDDSLTPPALDAESDLVCGESSTAVTNFTPPCGECGGCPAGQVCTNGECKYRAGERRCQPAAPVPTCVSTGGCPFFNDDTSTPTGPGTRLDNTAFTFVDVEGYQDRTLYIHLNFDSLVPAEYDFTPYIMTCDGNGSFRAMRSNQLGCPSPQCWDSDGNIIDRPGMDRRITFNLDLDCSKPFYDGPITSLVSSGAIENGYMMKFTPSPGWTGTAHVSVALQAETSPAYEPIPIVWYSIHIRPGTPAFDQEGRYVVEMPGTGHYYENIYGPMNWSEALSAAAAKTYNGMQGHLVTISSAEENEFVRALADHAPSDIYLGLSDVASEGTFSWISHLEPLVYTNWATGEPNDGGGNGTEDFPMMNVLSGFGVEVGKWDDTDGQEEFFSAIVEYE